MTAATNDFTPVLLAWPDFSSDSLERLIRLIDEGVEGAVEPLLFLYHEPESDGSREAIEAKVQGAFERVARASLDLSVEVLTGPIGDEAWMAFARQISAQLVVPRSARRLEGLQTPLIHDADTLAAIIRGPRPEESLAARGGPSVTARKHRDGPAFEGREGEKTRDAGSVEVEAEITLLAWPEYSPEELDRLFASFGVVVTKRQGLRVLFGLNPSTDPSEEVVSTMLSDSFERTCGADLDLNASILPLPLSNEASVALSQMARAQLCAGEASRFVRGLAVPIVEERESLEAILRRPAREAGPAGGSTWSGVSDVIASPGRAPTGTHVSAAPDVIEITSTASPREGVSGAGSAAEISRVVILDPGLFGPAGHHLNMAYALQSELQELALPGLILCHAQASPVVKAVPAVPYFQVSGYHSREHRSEAEEYSDCVLSNAVFLEQLRQLSGSVALGSNDLILVPTVTSTLILGLAQWLTTFESWQRPRFAIGLMFQPDWHSTGATSPVGEALYRAAFAILPPAVSDRLVTVCETSALASEYAKLVGVQPILYEPHFLERLLREARTKSDGSALTVSFLGFGKREKGLHLLPDLVPQILDEVPEAVFQIQLSGGSPALLEHVAVSLAANGDRVTLVRGPVEARRMAEMMVATDLMLLPYDPDTYRTRGSGIFADCKIGGIPVVVPRESAMGSEVRSGGFGSTFDHFTAASVADAVVEGLRNLPTLRGHAERVAASSGRSEGYLSRIVDAFRS